MIQSSTNNGQLDIPGLRKECEQRAAVGRNVLASLKGGLVSLLEERFLKRAIFDRDPSLHDEEAVHAERYRILIKLLRSALNKDARQVVLTRFAWQEGICSPGEIIAEEALKTVRREIRRELRFFSDQDYTYYREVNSWIPFAKRLMADYREVRNRNNPKAELIRRHYNEREVSCVVGRRLRSGTDTNIACRLVAIRSNVQFSSIQNAYGRIARFAAGTPQYSR